MTIATGDNPGLALRLLLWQWPRFDRGQNHIDAGYCIDAPDKLVAGSTTIEYEDEDDWAVVPSVTDR